MANARSGERAQASRRAAELFGLYRMLWQFGPDHSGEPPDAGAFIFVPISRPELRTIATDSTIILLSLNKVMPDHLHCYELFSSSLVTISDWCCRPTEPAFGAEEESSGHVLVFPRTGVYVERRGGRENVVADPTRILFFNANETYRVAHPVSGGDDCTAIRFDASALVEFARLEDPCAEENCVPFQLPSVGSTNAMVLILHRLRRNLLARRAPNTLAVEEEATALLSQAREEGSRRRGHKSEAIRADTRKAHRDLVYASRILLSERFREKLSLSDIARAVFSSPFHLARIFRRETGSSLHAYQNRLRLRASINEIADGARDLTRLALELGFSSHAHFSYAFHRDFLASPSELRKQLSSERMRKLSRNPKA
jgi:AraC family transcriptional regulator